MPDPESPATEILRRLTAGDDDAPAQLYDLVEAELRRQATAMMRAQGEGHTLQPTALVHEAWLKLTAGEGGSWRDQGHFVATASSAMRQILVDHARAKAADKRGGDRRREPMTAADGVSSPPLDHLLALDDALVVVGREDERARKVAEMRLFGGLELREIAAALSLSPRSVDRAWRTARELLRDRLGDDRVG